MRRSALLAIGLFLASALASGCASDDQSIIWIQNNTGVVVDVFIAPVGASDSSLVWTGLTPGQGVAYDRIPRGCSEVEFIAKDRTGTLVARSPSPVCRPSVWVIRQPPG